MLNLRNSIVRLFLVLLMGYGVLPAHALTVEKERPSDESPLFMLVRPNWAFQFNGTANSFGGKHWAEGFSLSLEYQPAFLQSIGVLGFGPSIGSYPTLNFGQRMNIGLMLTAGGQVRYQLKFARNQFIVPTVSYAAEYIRYNYGDFTSTFVTHGPIVGLMFNLGWLDVGGGRDLFESTGIARSYLVVEWRNLKGGSSDLSNIQFRGNSFYLGYRLEF